METEEHLRLLRRGTEVWNQWKAGHPLIRANLGGAELAGVSLSKAYLNGAIFNATNLAGADLRGAVLRDANLDGAVIREADLSGASLRDASLFQANLRGASLRAADLRGANFVQADLEGADLRGADLRRADLAGADVRRADLGETNLSGADFRGARLNRSDLRGALLSGTDFSGADLAGVELAGARVGWARFGDVDLSVVKGLEQVVHLGPSTTGIDTVYRSKGKIPDLFLRGAGVPNIFLTFMASLVGQPIEFFACFISASAEDRRFCDRLHADLQAKGVRTWYLPEEAARDGAGWDEIDRGLKVWDKLVVVCSESSLRSAGVLGELGRALEREDDGGGVLFPILLDDYLMNGWQHGRKPDVLRKVVGDFRGWEGSADRYDDALQALLAALTEARAAAQPET